MAAMIAPLRLGRVQLAAARRALATCTTPLRPRVVELLDGVALPCETLGDSSRGPLIWGHGLGPQEPWAMTRRSCERFQVASAALGASRPQGSEVELPAAHFSLVLYDARGHGASRGWESSDCSRPCSTQQFHWRNLGVDMLFVADRHRNTGAGAGALLGGYSMGASSALWAAFLCPVAVRGLVLLSVTTAWEIRAARRGSLVDIAEDHRRQGRLDAASVVLGAAAADLPPLEDVRTAGLRMPALLAAARDDPTHPAEVVERLAAALPEATLLITDTTQELNGRFPEALRRWHRRHFSDSPG